MALEQTVRASLLRLRFFKPHPLTVALFLIFLAYLSGSYADLKTGFHFSYLFFVPAVLLGSLYAMRFEKRDNTSDLLRKANYLHTSLQEEEILQETLLLLVPKIADWVIIYSVDENGLLQQSKSHHVLAAKKAQLETFQPTASHPIFQVIQNHKGTVINQKQNSILMVPLFAQNNLQAVLMLGMSESGRDYQHLDLQVMEQFADIAAWALLNAKLYAQAKEEIKMRDEHLSIASHELKTPLTLTLLKLQNVLQNIRQQPLATFSVEKMMEMLESAQQQTTRLTNLIKDLMDLSAASTGRLSLTKEEMELSNIVQEMVIRFEEQLKEAECPIAVKADVMVLGNWDPLRIEQVVANLLSNAVKYGKGKPIEVSVEKNGTHALLKVSDKGIGMTPQQQEIIFKRFKRAVSNPEYKGLGVGLYVTEQIVEAHGGMIQVESVLGEGSTFIVTLPLGNNPPKEISQHHQNFLN